MRHAPVVLFVYNRADHFISTYEALAKCEGAKETELFIFSDGPKNEEGKQKVNEVRQAISERKEKDDFQNLHVIESEKNRGLVKSIISGVTEVVKKYGRVIVIEDDCVVSPYILSYMNQCLDRYESDKEIGSITGYAPQISLPESNQSDVFLARRSCSHTWATWADRWEGIDWSKQNVIAFYRSHALRKKLNSNGTDRFLRLYRQSRGKGNSWSISFGAHHAKQDWWVIYPRYSYVQDIGCDNSGEHCKAEDETRFEVDLTQAIAKPDCTKPAISEKIQKEMFRFYSGGPWSECKHFMISEGICLLYRIGMLR